MRTTCVEDCAISVRPCLCPPMGRRGAPKGERGKLRLIAHLLPRFSAKSPEVPNLGNGDEAPGERRLVHY